jgi:uncharacterized protein
MAIIVSDTSPHSLLLRLGLECVLEQLFEAVLIPPRVMSELSHRKSPDEVRSFAVSPPAWVTIRAPAFPVVHPKLDPGESEAIALAVELKSLLLIDETNGRKFALESGLEIVGAIGILERAAIAGLIADPVEVYDRIRAIRFHISRKRSDESLARILAAIELQ